MSKSKSKQTVDTTVIMSKMDYEIAKRVYEYCLAIGLSDEELSFLMGKRNKYYFDLLNPTEKDKIKTEQLDMLPAILELHIREIVPNNIKPGEQIKIHGSKKVSATKIVYRHTVVYPDGTESAEIIWTKKVLKGERKQVNESLHSAVSELVHDGYFGKQRNALELYLTLKDKIKDLSFTPADLQKSLAVLMNKKRQQPPLLECKSDNARYGYYALNFIL